jgi:UDP-arabinose 4-epimerase
MRSILVTGGAGYIGSHACKALARAGYYPIAYDSLERGHSSAVRWGPLERGDVSDKGRLADVIRRYRPDAVLHFAAYAYVGESVANPGKYYRNNVGGMIAILEAIRDFGVESLVFSSTCATYGNPRALPITEDHPQLPVNPYGASKLFAERMMADFARAHPLKYVALRYFNAAGADRDGDIGEDHQPETHLIPAALQAALGVRPPIEIYGSDYDTTDGTAVRDYIHVSDLADAHVHALEYLLNEGKNAAVNLGTGYGHTVLQVIEEIHRVTGRQVPSRVAPRRTGDPPILVADGSNSKCLLNWEPKQSQLSHIIATAWRWIQRQPPGGPWRY